MMMVWIGEFVDRALTFLAGGTVGFFIGHYLRIKVTK